MFITPLEVSAAVTSVAVMVGAAGLAQKWANDRREALWKRAQWAIDLTLSDSPAKRLLGYKVIRELAQLHNLSDTDQGILANAVRRALDDGDP